MARPGAVSRVVISGHMEATERFAWGFWLGNVEATQAANDTACNAIRDYFQNYAKTGLCGLLSSTSGYDKVTLYGYGTTGTAAQWVSEAAITAGDGTSTGSSLPTQVAWVVSLRTGRPGRRYRGRYYVPVDTKTLTNHQFDSGLVASLLAGQQSFFNAINASAVINGQVAVISEVGEGAVTPVTTLTADSRLDIQRRRADSLGADATASLPVS